MTHSVKTNWKESEFSEIALMSFSPLSAGLVSKQTLIQSLKNNKSLETRAKFIVYFVCFKKGATF